MNSIDKIMDMIIQDKPSEAKELLDKELQLRIAKAISDKKPEIATKIFDKKVDQLEPEDQTELEDQLEPEEKTDETDNGDK